MPSRSKSAHVVAFALAISVLGPPTLVVAQESTPSADPPATDATAPTEHGRLADVFPTELGGQPWDELTVNVGQEIIDERDANNPEDRTVEGFLAATGASIDDVTGASGLLQAEDGAIAWVSAIQAVGVPAERISEHFVEPSFAEALVQPREEPGEISGKVVRTFWDDEFPESPPGHVYLTGDTVWLVIATEPLLTELFETIP